MQNLNPLSHPNATLVPQARQARASGENLNYMTLAPPTREARQGCSDILSMIIDGETQSPTVDEWFCNISAFTIKWIMET